MKKNVALEQKYLNTALKLAQKAASKNEVPVGALVLYQDKVISRAYNLREKKHDPTAHAEILALRSAARKLKSWRLTDCTLVVTLEPCPMCLAACQQARITKVIYGAQDLKGGALSLGYRLHEDSKTNHRFSVEWVNMPECGKVLSGFFRNRRA